MATHAIDFLYKHARGDLWLNEMKLTEFGDHVSCRCCERSADKWIMPNQGVVTRDGITCTACQIIYEGSFELLGVESIRGPKTLTECPWRIDSDPYGETPGFGFDLRPASEGKPEKVCSSCKKRSSVWENPHRGMQIKIDGAEKLLCLACYAPYEDRLGFLKNPRIMHYGIPVPAKLGMLSKCAMVCSPEETIVGLTHTEKEDEIKKKAIVGGELVEKAVKEVVVSGWYSKVSIAPGFPYEHVQKSGREFLKHIARNPPKPPFLFIEEFDRAKDMLFKNLKVTTDIRRTYLCSQKGMRVYDLNRIAALHDLLDDFKKKSTQSKICQALTVHFVYDPSKTNKEFYDNLMAEKNELAMKILGILPDSPWEAVDLLNYARSI